MEEEEEGLVGEVAEEEATADTAAAAVLVWAAAVLVWARATWHHLSTARQRSERVATGCAP